MSYIFMYIHAHIPHIHSYIHQKREAMNLETIKEKLIEWSKNKQIVRAAAIVGGIMLLLVVSGRQLIRIVRHMDS